MAYVRLVERWLFKCRGHPPVVVERLACGHAKMTKVAAHWVKDKKFPTEAPLERLCKACAGGYLPMNDLPDGEVVCHESFDLLTQIAKASVDKQKEPG